MGAGEGWGLEEASCANELVPHKNAPIMDIWAFQTMLGSKKQKQKHQQNMGLDIAIFEGTIDWLMQKVRTNLYVTLSWRKH